MKNIVMHARRFHIAFVSLAVLILFAPCGLGGPIYNAINLEPTGFTESTILATDGVHQVGAGKMPDGIVHALLWNGSAASYVDLHPGDYPDSTALGIGGGQQVGYQFGPVPLAGFVDHAV